MSHHTSHETSEPLLVVAHEATRTGSPAVLLDLLRAARGQLGAPLAVRLLSSGPLARDLADMAEVSSVSARPAAVLVNSALGAEALFGFPPEVPTAVYVHEQGGALAALPDPALHALRTRADLVLAVSHGTVEDLVGMGVERSRIVILPPVVDLTAPDPAAAQRARSSLGLAEGRQLVVGCGAASWRKGTDLFVAAAALLRRERDVHLAWIGRRSPSFRRVLDQDCRDAGLGSDLSWVGEVDDPRPWLAAADVLVMTSREDPQPLVPFEAAAAGTPTVAFAVGGLADMGTAGAALTVPYPDVARLAAETARLLDDRSGADELASRALEWSTAHHGVDVVAPRFAELMRDLVRGRHTTAVAP